jgi:hypothetical protein
VLEHASYFDFSQILYGNRLSVASVIVAIVANKANDIRDVYIIIIVCILLDDGLVSACIH